MDATLGFSVNYEMLQQISTRWSGMAREIEEILALGEHYNPDMVCLGIEKGFRVFVNELMKENIEFVTKAEAEKEAKDAREQRELAKQMQIESEKKVRSSFCCGFCGGCCWKRQRHPPSSGLRGELQSETSYAMTARDDIEDDLQQQEPPAPQSPDSSIETAAR